ncbi:Cell cycle regulatory protein Speedy [Trinorchestia longiramus]|nr:Cell cycle regulatory protein Speedy [Trinorchestia longiramus]
MEVDGLPLEEYPTVVTETASAALVSWSARHYARQKKRLRSCTIPSPSLSSVERVLFTDKTLRPVKTPKKKPMVLPEFSAAITIESDDDSEIFLKTAPRKLSLKRKQLSLLLSDTHKSGRSGKSLGHEKGRKLNGNKLKSSKHPKKRKRVENPDSDKSPLELSSDHSSNITDDANVIDLDSSCKKSNTVPQINEKAPVKMRRESFKGKNRNTQKIDLNNNVELSFSRKRKEVTNVLNMNVIEAANIEEINKPAPKRKPKTDKSRPVQAVGPWNVMVEEQASGDCSSEISACFQSSTAAGQPAVAASTGDNATRWASTAHGDEGSRNDAVLSIEGKLHIEVLSSEKFAVRDRMKSGAQKPKPLNTHSKMDTSKSSSTGRASGQSSDDLYWPAVKHRSNSSSSNHQKFNLGVSKLTGTDLDRKTDRKCSISPKLKNYLKNKTNLVTRDPATYNGDGQCTEEQQKLPEKVTRRHRCTTRVTTRLTSPGPGLSVGLSLEQRNNATSQRDDLVTRKSVTKTPSSQATTLRKAKRSFKKGGFRRKQQVCPRALWLLVPGFNEQYAQSVVPVFNQRSKRTVKHRGEPDTVLLAREDLEAYFTLLEDAVVRELLERDSCHVYADKYLLAIVFVYFLRAQLPLNKFDRLHFFAALYLAHDLEEDDDALKYELVQWLVKDETVNRLAADKRETKQHTGAKLNNEDDFGQERKLVPSIVGCRPTETGTTAKRGCKTYCMKHLLLTTRDLLFWGMKCRAIVSKATCEKVMTCGQQHWAWQRQRPDHHGDCVRHNHWAARRRGNLLRSAKSEAACHLCNEASIARTMLAASSLTPADGGVSSGKGEKDSGYESMLVEGGGDHEAIFSEMRQNFAAFTIPHDDGPQSSSEEAMEEASTNTSDEIFPSAPIQMPEQLHTNNYHHGPALKKTRRRLLLSLKPNEIHDDTQLRDKAWTTTQKPSQVKQHASCHTNADLTGHNEQRRKSKRSRVTVKRCSCMEETTSRNTKPTQSDEAPSSLLPQPTPRRPKLQIRDRTTRPKNLSPFFDHLHVSNSAKSGDRITNSRSGHTEIQQNEGKYFCHASHAFKKNFMLDSVKKWFSHCKAIEIFADKYKVSRYQSLTNATRVLWFNDKSISLPSDLVVSRAPSSGSDRLSQAETVLLYNSPRYVNR